MTYGWVRAEILGGLINGVFLLSLCFNIAIEAIQRFFDPPGIFHVEIRLTSRIEITRPVLLLIVAAVGLAFNIVGLLIFSGHAGGGHSHSHGHGHGHGHGKVMELPKFEDDEEKEIEVVKVRNISFLILNSIKEKSTTMHSVWLHVLGDAFGSIAVIASSLFIWLTDFKWRFYVDPAIR
jgi:zinc transporter 1